MLPMIWSQWHPPSLQLQYSAITMQWSVYNVQKSKSALQCAADTIMHPPFSVELLSSTHLHCRALKSTAEHCTAALQSIALLHCKALQCTAEHCRALHCSTAEHLSVEHCRALHCRVESDWRDQPRHTLSIQARLSPRSWFTFQLNHDFAFLHLW